MPDKKYSENENRPLKQKVDLNYNDFNSGYMQKESETYLNDQFIGRDILHSLKTNIDVFLGVRIFDDVLIGKENMLFQTFDEVEENTIVNKADSINNLMNEYQNIHYSMLLIPNKIAIYEELLPNSYPKSNELEVMNTFINKLDKKIQISDTYSVLKENKEDSIYYSSDHHWTTKGAYLVFNQWLMDQGYDASTITYKPHISNAHFFGTLANRSGYRKKSDQIELYLPTNSDIEYLVYYEEDKKQTTSIYDSSKQLSSDPYAVFLGGNYPRIDIETSASNQNHLLLFKDSYANCMIEFLLPYYSEITIIDPRYYYEDIYKLIEEKQISDVLFLYNANTFFHDTSLEELIK